MLAVVGLGIAWTTPIETDELARVSGTVAAIEHEPGGRSSRARFRIALDSAEGRVAGGGICLAALGSGALVAGRLRARAS